MHCSQTLMCFVAVLGATVGIAIAQERRVSVATKDGDLVEGTFRGATNASVSVVIAGQKISIPTDNVKYISFAGKLEGSGDVDSEATEFESAFAAIEEFQASLEIGLLREQFNEKLVETMPTVRSYIKSTGDEWADVKLAFALAIQDYQATINQWRDRNQYIESAREWTEYAQFLRRESSANHRESDEHQMIESHGFSTTGRLGVGDVLMPAMLDKSTAGAFNDVYLLEIEQSGELTINVKKQLGLALLHTTVVAPDGKKIEGDMGRGTVRTKKKLNRSGRYEVWIGGGIPQGVGIYRVQFKFEVS